MNIRNIISVGYGCVLLSQGLFASPLSQGAYVKSVRLAGSGCQASAVEWELKENSLQIKSPEISVNASGEDRFLRKNCQAIVDLVKPQGWTYRVQNVQYQGWAFISNGTQASIQSSHYLQGSSASYRGERIFPSNFQGSYTFVNRRIGEWAPCNLERALNVNTALVLRKPADRYGWSHFMVHPNVSIKLEWKRCG